MQSYTILYRDQYAQNLRREFPRIPLWPDFGQWATWGETLMGLHVNFESATKHPLKQTVGGSKQRKLFLKADKESGQIRIDEATTLSEIPSEAWRYKLGKRSALEWILDQYSESSPRDPTVREKFDAYKFSDYKSAVIELLARVTTVSMKTVEICDNMKEARRS